ncbi:hypothetical protein [Gloeocapsopsis sp. IPPAS B-1203]|uniref:hypothetical protein n=1 Tax=Gloeocapsopsis sp. IPPAS B-1203 TaxID=2049454 RepID=UPI000C1A1555|nr:hypothetical protein [Gloeocapsopsis sp. IPPAS B-1203]PIG92201.1 hypothetical protein CSQ79_16320 [Gloeocapsopsis sp. IPPAS B-1203]
MNNQMTWKYIFQLKAVINWVESIFLLLSDQWIREVLGEKPLINSEYSHLFLALVFAIGIGYWWVGNDISRNHGIVKLGIIAQSSVFLVLAYHTLISNLHPFYLIPGVIDLTFAILFGIFLNSYNRTQTATE